MKTEFQVQFWRKRDSGDAAHGFLVMRLRSCPLSGAETVVLPELENQKILFIQHSHAVSKSFNAQSAMRTLYALFIGVSSLILY